MPKNDIEIRGNCVAADSEEMKAVYVAASINARTEAKVSLMRWKLSSASVRRWQIEFTGLQRRHNPDFLHAHRNCCDCWRVVPSEPSNNNPKELFVTI
jgi:hypothetical protein